MSKQRITTLHKIISKIDILILKQLDIDEFEDDKISTLSELKQDYLSELSDLIRVTNKKEMFN